MKCADDEQAATTTSEPWKRAKGLDGPTRGRNSMDPTTPVIPEVDHDSQQTRDTECCSFLMPSGQFFSRQRGIMMLLIDIARRPRTMTVCCVDCGDCVRNMRQRAARDGDRGMWTTI